MKELLSEYVFLSRYAHYREEEGRYETYDEAVDRVINMHKDHLSGMMFRDKISRESLSTIDVYLKLISQEMKKKKLLPSMRSMQFGGSPILKNHARMYNCCASYANRIEFFKQAVYLLLCGCGVGYSVQKHHVEQLPPVIDVQNIFPVPTWKIHLIEDSIEGWAEAFDELIKAYLVTGIQIKFEYALIREEGSPILGGLGKAPGHMPLKKSLMAVRDILAQVKPGERLSTLQVHDIVCHMANCVIAGGTRRSALIALFSPDDKDMINCKTGDWWNTNPQRARANNSAVLVRSENIESQFREMIKKTEEFGEPGFIFTDSAEHLTNPCAEIGLYGYVGKEHTPENSGFQFCNLTTINFSKVESVSEFHYLCKLSAVLGTIQASYTNFHPDVFGEDGGNTAIITRKESLLGCSVTGLLDNQKFSVMDMKEDEFREMFETGKAQLDATAADVASMLNMPKPARTTCIKPEGTTSVLLGTTSGIHPAHARKYIRHVQCNKKDLIAKALGAKIPEMVDNSAYSDTDYCLSFAIENGKNTRTMNDVTEDDMIKLIKKFYLYWIGGKSGVEDETLSHNVSNTINVKDGNWDLIANLIWDAREYVSGISLIKSSGAYDYIQAPFCEVSNNYESTHHISDLLNNMDNFSFQDVENTYRKLLPVIRFLSNEHKFNSIKNKYEESELYDKKSVMEYIHADETPTIDLTGTIACSGGSCEIV